MSPTLSSNVQYFLEFGSGIWMVGASPVAKINFTWYDRLTVSYDRPWDRTTGATTDLGRPHDRKLDRADQWVFDTAQEAAHSVLLAIATLAAYARPEILMTACRNWS